MGYLHINNLYKDQTILLFKECYAMEKIHGTSAHISWKNGKLNLFSGAEKLENFKKLFDISKLESIFKEKNLENAVIFGEAYGGKCQAMSAAYGKELKFIAFDVKIGDLWLNLQDAEWFCYSFGIEFVSYNKIPCELKYIDQERDADSIQAIRNGCGEGKLREGIVLRPLIEFIQKNGARIIAKHKRDEFRETRKIRKVNTEKLEILTQAKEIAREWVTIERARHVIDKVFQSEEPKIEKIADFIKAMLEDILREAKGEILETREAKKAISTESAILFKKHLFKANETTYKEESH